MHPLNIFFYFDAGLPKMKSLRIQKSTETLVRERRIFMIDVLFFEENLEESDLLFLVRSELLFHEEMSLEIL